MDTEQTLLEKLGSKETWIEIVQIIFGCCLLATGIYFFQFPNHFAIGGVTGISIILNTFFKNISPGTFVLVINASLLVLGFIIFGKSFTIKTVFASLLMSALLKVLENVIPINAPLTDDPLLELIFGVTIPAIGSAILFNNMASSGGTDIIAMIVKKFTAFDIGD
ncbi:MAG: YitT family protein, partial [Christensenellaceae bacterium]|nr:YitT family protein [Christensenellaceae bacterium]